MTEPKCKTWEQAKEALTLLSAEIQAIAEPAPPHRGDWQMLERMTRDDVDALAMRSVLRQPTPNVSPALFSLLAARVHFASSLVNAMKVPEGAHGRRLEQPFESADELCRWLLVDVWHAQGAAAFQSEAAPPAQGGTRFVHLLN